LKIAPLARGRGNRDPAGFTARCIDKARLGRMLRRSHHMCLADVLGTHEVITAAATAEVPEHQPAICGTVTLHCVDGDETLRLSMPMPDALLLLNSLRAIEEEFELQGWAEQIGCSATAMEEVAAELAQFSEDLSGPSASLN